METGTRSEIANRSGMTSKRLPLAGMGTARLTTLGPWLLAILLAAFGLRAYGIDFGREFWTPLEFSYHLDEPITLTRAVQMSQTLDLNPHWFHYPSLLIYANFAVLKAASLLGGGDPYILARGLTALLGTLTVAVTFLLGRRVGGTRAGTLAAILLSVSFLHVRSSHFVTTDVPMTLFTTACGLFLVRYGADGRRRDLWLSFAAAGLAAGTKYNGAFVVILPLVGVLLHERDPWTKRLGLGAIGVVAATVSFIMTTPFLLVEPESFRNWFSYVYEYQKKGQFGFEHPSFGGNLAYLSNYLFWKGLGPVGGALALVGAGRVLIGAKRIRRLPLVAFPMLYLVWLASYRTSFTRNLMPIVPFMAVFAALALDAFLVRWVDGLRPRRAALWASGALSVILVIAWPLRDSVAYDLAISRSTRTRSIPWILENVPPGSRIATEVYGPPLHVTHPGRYELRRTWNLGMDVPSTAWLQRTGTDFIISNSGAYEMVFSNPGRYPAAENLYREIERRYPLIKIFEGEDVDPLYSSISPTIKIYDCRPSSVRR